MALNLSKSVSLALVALRAIFLAIEVSSHFLFKSNFLMASIKVPVLGFLRMGILNLVKFNLLMGMTCLSTPVVGPSMRTFLSQEILVLLLLCFHWGHPRWQRACLFQDRSGYIRLFRFQQNFGKSSYVRGQCDNYYHLPLFDRSLVNLDL